jgi:hypothetical protein
VTGYRVEEGRTLIELSLADVRQLFDNRDPAPFRDKDLDPAAAAYIESAAEEVASDVPLKLVVHLPAGGATATVPADVVAAVQGHFSGQSRLAGRRLATLLANGRLALLMGSLFLLLCSGLSLLVGELGLGWVGEVVEEGLVIIGWVALWRPAEIFLYDWWPLRQQRRQMHRLATMPVELRCMGLGEPGDRATTIAP